MAEAVDSAPRAAQRANYDVPYEDRPWDDELCLEALEHCPWKDTDHDRGEGQRRENYCTWCDGYVTAAIEYRKELPVNHLQRSTS